MQSGNLDVRASRGHPRRCAAMYMLARKRKRIHGTHTLRLAGVYVAVAKADEGVHGLRRQRLKPLLLMGSRMGGHWVLCSCPKPALIAVRRSTGMQACWAWPAGVMGVDDQHVNMPLSALGYVLFPVLIGCASGQTGSAPLQCVHT